MSYIAPWAKYTCCSKFQFFALVKCHTELFHVLSHVSLKPLALQTNRLGLPRSLLSLFKITTFRNITFCSLVGKCQHFGRACCLLILMEDGGSRFLWNTGTCIPYYIGVMSWKTNVKTHCCENLRFHCFPYIFQYTWLNKIWMQFWFKVLAKSIVASNKIIM